jgi:dihydroorotate dehydrogenase electron transfer subunit
VAGDISDPDGLRRLADALAPGQFVHVRVPGLEPTALRRPFSVFDADAGRVTLLYKVVGRGTAALAHVRPGDGVEVLGPLGHGFPSSSKGVPLLVGGGYGVAPLHFLAKCLKDPRAILFVGGRTKDDLLALDRFAALGVDVRIATNDGSAGEKGFVTGPLDAVLDGLRARGETFELFTCGPDGLLKAVADRAVAAKMPGWISMDRHMVCGVGACFACIQKIKLPNGDVFNARCCVNGPVFKAEDIVWNEE